MVIGSLCFNKFFNSEWRNSRKHDALRSPLYAHRSTLTALRSPLTALRSCCNFPRFSWDITDSLSYVNLCLLFCVMNFCNSREHVLESADNYHSGSSLTLCRIKVEKTMVWKCWDQFTWIDSLRENREEPAGGTTDLSSVLKFHIMIDVFQTATQTIYNS
jgi:hypothetical protein